MIDENSKYVNDLIALTTELNEFVLSHKGNPDRIDIVDYSSVLNAVVISMYKSCMLTAVNAMDVAFIDVTKEDILKELEEAFILDFKSVDSDRVTEISHNYDVM